MLVLSRHENQSISLADGLIYLTIVKTQPDRVRIGIDAPKSISILRTEVDNKRTTDTPRAHPVSADDWDKVRRLVHWSTTCSSQNTPAWMAGLRECLADACVVMDRHK